MSSMTITRRPIWLALVITPLLTPLAFFLAYASYFFAAGYNRPGLSWAGSLAFMYLFGVPLGYLAIGILGWPWVTKLIQWQKLTVGYVCGGACVIGMGAFLAFAALIKGRNEFSLNGVPQQIAIGLLIGLLAGLIFCAIAGIPIKSRK
jgi:hypothetical protein